MGLIPVLQIVHVTDCHFKHPSSNPLHKLQGPRRFLARTIQYAVERFDWFGWNEGIQGHYHQAPESFRRFLAEWRAKDDRWYGAAAGEDSARTWLIDTGDLSAI